MTLPPWSNYPDSLNNELVEWHTNFQGKLSTGEIVLSQFVDKGDVVSYMDNFWWREYFIVASVALAIDSTVQPAKTFLVEGGVCDGWSAWFALNCATAHSAGADYWGYDLWEGMREDELLDSEIAKAGSYSYLSVDQTHRNLREFGGNIRLCKGFVPASLVEFDGPPSVHWLHIDLNAARPSVEMVAHFWNRIPRGGVVLLDDYSWPGYRDTKRLVDEFLVEKQQWVIALPTGQGLFVKS